VRNLIVLRKESLNSDGQQFNQTVTSHLISLNIKKTMSYDAGNPGTGLGQTKKCGRVKPIIGIPPTPLLMQVIRSQVAIHDR
jgi:hypothetical protein